MEIKILGTGCSKCRALEANTLEALKELGVEAKVTKVTELAKIMDYDVMMTPGLVIDEIVKVSGRVASKEDIKRLIEEMA